MALVLTAENNPMMASSHIVLWLSPIRVNFRHCYFLYCSARNPMNLHPIGLAENMIYHLWTSRAMFLPLLHHPVLVRFLAKILSPIQRFASLHRPCFRCSTFCSQGKSCNWSRSSRFVRIRPLIVSPHLSGDNLNRAYASSLPILQ